MIKSPDLQRFDSRSCMYALRYGRSHIHGVGVFALECIPRGKKVIEYTGERLTTAQATRRYRRILSDGNRPNCLLRLNHRWILDGARHGSGAERINHSCDPNLRPKNTNGHMWFLSKRRIHIGEELTLDYRYGADLPSVRCRCGTCNCRGTINLKR